MNDVTKGRVRLPAGARKTLAHACAKSPQRSLPFRVRRGRCIGPSGDDMAMRLGSSPMKRRAMAAALVFAGCYAGARADELVRFPGLGTAILFAPYAVLTTALVRFPPRLWWLFLLAASAGDYLPHRGGGASVSFALMTESANFLRATLAAVGLRRFARSSNFGERVSETVAFLAFAVFLAPGAGALAGAAIVRLHGATGDFWLAWQEWWLSNAVTALTLLPLLHVGVNLATAKTAAPSPSVRRAAEASLLIFALLAVGGWVFLRSFDPSRIHPARLFWPLPFLLWAAVRFGPTGTSAALLAVTSLSIWGALARRGPFVTQAPADNLIELQTFLLGISVPLLLLASLFRQQQRTAAALEESKRLYQVTEAERRQMEVRRALDEVQREADRRKDEFLATLGHELRNPLAPIGIALETLRAAAPDRPDATSAIDSIRRQLQHMTRLLDDLLDISRITLGKIRLQRETVNLAQVVANAVETARPVIDERGHELAVTLPDAPVHLRGDVVRLTQVAANLLNNAAKYTEPGGRIEIAVRQKHDLAILSVRDNGIGVPPESLEQIFELFTQMPAARERAPGGLGIGLSLVKRLVELHGGTVEARRRELPPGGTEIIVRLPATDRPATPVPPRAPRAAAAEIPLRILAVDDNRDIAEGLAQVLGMWGHTVRTAPDGATALEIAGAFGPEVVLLDLGLPKIDGFEVARRLLRADAPPPTLLISMSGFGQDQARRESRKAGFHHHIVKPIDMEALRAMLAVGTKRSATVPPRERS
jgi:signal transduction histidine kinase/ActR/RegA family two-component response regulator